MAMQENIYYSLIYVYVASHNSQIFIFNFATNNMQKLQNL